MGYILVVSGHDLLPTPCTYATQHQLSLLTRQNRNEAKDQALPLVTDSHSDVDSSPASCPRRTGLIPRSANRASFIFCFPQSLSKAGITFQINVLFASLNILTFVAMLSRYSVVK